jgi:uncharacterized protein
MVWSEAANFMLLIHANGAPYEAPIPPKTSSEVMLALSCHSREAVSRLESLCILA